MQHDSARPASPDRTASSWAIMLPKDAPAVRTARSAVEGWMADAPAGLRDDARSVVTELVSNAVRYGQPPIRLTLERDARGWRIDVTDAGSEHRKEAAAGGEHGWGLRIVAALAESWGTADQPSRVWCRLRDE
jgi:anti-sigma regulatory factor (Ser/Thr protein kinase)